MRSARDLGVILWLLCAALIAGWRRRPDESEYGRGVDDRLLANKVKVALLSDPQVSGRQIMVEGSQGVIQLRGVVHSPAEAQRAVQVAQQVKGVKEVRNHLTVQ